MLNPYLKIIFHEDRSKSSNEFKFAAFYLNSSGRVVGVATLDWDPVCAVFAELLYAGKHDVRKEHVDLDPMDIKRLLI